MNANVLGVFESAMEKRAVVRVDEVDVAVLVVVCFDMLWLLIYILIYRQFSAVCRAQHAK